MQHIKLNTAKVSKASDRKTLAILAYDNACYDSDIANWRAVAELLRLAIPSSKVKTETETDSKFAPLVDYPIPHNASGKRLGKSPIAVITFANGEIVRVPAVSLPGKPTNIGRALRVAVAFYEGRIIARRNADLIAADLSSLIFSVTDLDATGSINIPTVISAICETTGAEYNPQTCSNFISR